MENKRVLKTSLLCLALFLFVFIPTTVFAIEDNDEQIETTASTDEVHKVAVITTKVDENGSPLAGATLQIIDSEGNVVDEWVSDGSEHTSFVSDGDYTLHEVSAPAGYKVAEDQTFSVVVEIKEINADTDHDDELCKLYPAELYYVESEGEKEEVYCINQGWDEPNSVSYDGVVLSEDNIKSFIPESDPTMTDKEIYHKVLDIVYHRSKIQDKFPTLSNTEIRLLTEYALKNYTSAMVQDGNLYRHYRYDPSVQSKYVVDYENGNSLGKLVQHYWQFRNGRNVKRADGTIVYEKHGEFPDLYNEVYQWLIRDEDHHPADMHLYVYSAQNMTADGEMYQNLLGIKWFNPYDENYKVELKMVNETEEVPPETEIHTTKKIYHAANKTEIAPPITGVNTTNTNNNGLIIIISLLSLLVTFVNIRVNE